MESLQIVYEKRGDFLEAKDGKEPWRSFREMRKENFGDAQLRLVSNPGSEVYPFSGGPILGLRSELSSHFVRLYRKRDLPSRRRPKRIYLGTGLQKRQGGQTKVLKEGRRGFFRWKGKNGGDNLIRESCGESVVGWYDSAREKEDDIRKFALPNWKKGGLKESTVETVSGKKGA